VDAIELMAKPRTRVMGKRRPKKKTGVVLGPEATDARAHHTRATAFIGLNDSKLELTLLQALDAMRLFGA